MIKAGSLLEGYEFLELIGRGGFSSVWKVRSLKYECLFVAKVATVKVDVDRTWKAFDSEVQALIRLDHPNIISLYAHFRYSDNFILILEYLRNGSVYDWIRRNGALEETILYQVVKDVCSALRYAWSQGIQHRDVKPQNIMLDENRRAKLVDFGISVMNEAGHLETSDFTCSMVCAAPEIIGRRPYDPLKSDVWATGITILWLVRGEIPWLIERTSELLVMIAHGSYIIPSSMDPTLRSMVTKMLAMCPEERVFPTAEQIVALGGGGSPVKGRCRKTSGPSELVAFQSVGRLKIGQVVMRNPVTIRRPRLNSDGALLKRLVLPEVGTEVKGGGSLKGNLFMRDNKALSPLSPLAYDVPQLSTLLDQIEA